MNTKQDADSSLAGSGATAVRPRGWALAIHPRFGGGDYVCSTLTENGLPYEPLYDQAGVNAFVSAAVAKERAWFAKVLSEWDKTEDVEDVLRMRLDGPNEAVTRPCRMTLLEDEKAAARHGSR